MTLLRFNSIIDFTDTELDVLIYAGIKTLQSFIMKDASYISQATSIPAKKIRTNQDKLMKSLASPVYNLEVFEDRFCNLRFYLSTKCPKLDQMLNGGIMTGQITELNGPSGSGKTQFCLYMSFILALQGKEVLYIDTDGDFSAERLFIMHNGNEFDETVETIIKRIHVYRILSFYNLMQFLDVLLTDLSSPVGYYRNICLIILDSYANSFVELIEYKQHAKRWSALVQVMSNYNNALRTIITDRRDIAIMFTDRLKDVSHIRRNNCGLVLNFEDNQDGTRQITCLQSERIAIGSTIVLKLDNTGFTDDVQSKLIPPKTINLDVSMSNGELSPIPIDHLNLNNNSD